MRVRTKLQKWIKDKNITLDDLKKRGFVTIASDIRQIVMVTTPNSLKYLKFAGNLSERNIRKWAKNASSSFGAGLIYSLLSNYDKQKAIEFAVAASCLKHSIEGDYNMVSVSEVQTLANGDASGRVQR